MKIPKAYIYTMKRILEFSDLYLDTLSLSLLDLAEFPPNEPPNIFLKYAKRDNRFLIKYWQMIGEQSRFRNQIVEYFVNQGMSSEMKYLNYTSDDEIKPESVDDISSAYDGLSGISKYSKNHYIENLSNAFKMLKKSLI